MNKKVVVQDGPWKMYDDKTWEVQGQIGPGISMTLNGTYLFNLNDSIVSFNTLACAGSLHRKTYNTDKSLHISHITSTSNTQLSVSIPERSYSPMYSHFSQ